MRFFATLFVFLLGLSARAEIDALPPLKLLRVLPCPETVSAQLAESERWMERIIVAHLWDWAQKCATLDKRSRAWRYLQQAHDRGFGAEKRSEYQRRQALGWLVNEVGWRAVLMGQLPAAVPLEWYRLVP